MFSLQKFFGKDPQFFELLESAALEAQQGAGIIRNILGKDPASIVLNDLRASRKRSKDIFEKIGKLVVVTFVTSLEREDIEALSNSLYKILKPLEKFAERLMIANGIVKGTDFSGQIQIIEEATKTVVEMVRQVRKAGNLEVVQQMLARLHQTESQADALELDLLKELYREANDNPLRVVLVKDLYDLLEKSIDRCRDVGNVVMHIVLKNS